MPDKHETVPFFGNHNGMSCGQCVYKMMFSSFLPEQEWSFTQMDDFCGATPGKYTWSFRPLSLLNDHGLDVVFYTTFDADAFVAAPETYLLEKKGAEGQAVAIKNSDMAAVVSQARDYIKIRNTGGISEINEYYTPEILRALLSDGYLVNLWVNSRRLNGADGTAGHYILVYDFDDKGFFAHDPGGNQPDGSPLNQFKARYIEDSKLIDAVSRLVYGQTDDLIAVRPKKREEENA